MHKDAVCIEEAAFNSKEYMESKYVLAKHVKSLQGD